MRELTLVRSWFPHRDDAAKRVECFWSAPPPGDDLRPLVVIIHGHNMGLRLGARTDLFTGIVEYFAENGAVAASVSQPGYANSDGPADYCGPSSWAAVRTVIDALRDRPEARIDPERIALYGLSRGGTIALMTATEDARVGAVIAVAALYDMVDGYDALNDGIRESLAIETANTPAAFRARSPRYHVDRIDVPTLMIHGATDDVAACVYADHTFARAQALNKPFSFERFAQYGHGLPFATCCDLAGEFLHGVGIMDAPSAPYRLRFDRTP